MREVRKAARYGKITSNRRSGQIGVGDAARKRERFVRSARALERERGGQPGPATRRRGRLQIYVTSDEIRWGPSVLLKYVAGRACTCNGTCMRREEYVATVAEAGDRPDRPVKNRFDSSRKAPR